MSLNPWRYLMSNLWVLVTASNGQPCNQTNGEWISFSLTTQSALHCKSASHTHSHNDVATLEATQDSVYCLGPCSFCILFYFLFIYFTRYQVVLPTKISQSLVIYLHLLYHCMQCWACEGYLGHSEQDPISPAGWVMGEMLDHCNVVAVRML